EYFHDAWVEYCDGRGWELHRALRERRFAAPLRHVEADYLKPLRFGDRFDVGIFGVNIEGSDMNIGYRVARPDGELVATGQTLHVCVDPAAFRRLRSVPEDIRAAIAPLIVDERPAP